jgi:hypothetical protein
MSVLQKMLENQAKQIASLEGQIILHLLKVIKTACHETGYVTLFTTVIETSDSSFLYHLNFTARIIHNIQTGKF